MLRDKGNSNGAPGNLREEKIGRGVEIDAKFPRAKERERDYRGRTSWIDVVEFTVTLSLETYFLRYMVVL